MRASTDQVRHAAVDAVDAARSRTAGLVSSGADLVTQTLDKGASVVEGGIERVADKVPVVSVEATRPKRRHRVRTTLIALTVVVVVLAVAKKLMPRPETGTSTSTSSDDATTSSSAPTITSDDDTEPVSAGSG